MAPEREAEHMAWLARQYVLFAELLDHTYMLTGQSAAAPLNHVRRDMFVALCGYYTRLLRACACIFAVVYVCFLVRENLSFFLTSLSDQGQRLIFALC